MPVTHELTASYGGGSVAKENILIVEDEAIIAHGIKIGIEKMGYSAGSIVSRGADAIRKAEKDHPDLILMDIQLKGEMDGIEAADIIQSRFGIPVIFLTAYDDNERVKRAKSALPYGYVLKPFQDRDLKIAIEMGLYTAEMNALRKRDEEALRRSKELFEKTFQSQMDAIFILNSDSPPVIHDFNPAAEQTFGYTREEMLGRTIDLLHVSRATQMEFQKKVSGAVEKENFFRLPEFKMKRKNGTLFPSEHSVVPLKDQQGDRVGWVSVIRDISDRKRAETQTRETYKMEAIATLAGGVAHEFNNSLMGIMGHIELLKMNLPEDERRHKSLDTMNIAGHRMSRLTDQLLAYAQGGKYQPKNLKLDDFVIETLPILQHDLNPEVRVETHFQKDIWYVNADNTQMQMALSAILTNASEAIEDEGIIRITAENKDLDDDFAKQHPGFKPGHFVCLTIEDDGKGMDEKTRSGIFEPFFTTKFQGRGMGMAAVYGIVRNHDGWISVESELGKGTVVQIYLPAIEVEIEKPKEAKTEVATGSGTILMIEDEDVVIEVTQAMLEMLGYRVMVAKTGKDAIHIAETFDGQIDLALLDIKLPDIDGRNLYPLIMEARTNLKVIVFSGYSIDGPAREILDAGAQDFIQKPFSIATLSEKLKEVLEGK